MEYVAGGSLRRFRQYGMAAAAAAVAQAGVGETAIPQQARFLPASSDVRGVAATLTYRQLLGLLLEAAQGMAHLHRKGVVHLDLK